MSTRQPAVAGSFYPQNGSELSRFVLSALQKSALQRHKPQILIAPHAGFVYSGESAATAYKQLQNLDQSIEYTVLLIGPSHRVFVEGLSCSPDEKFLTPLGEVEIDTQEAKRLSQNHPEIHFDKIAHLYEHSLEVQLPFLISSLKRFKIVPLVYGNTAPQKILSILEDFLLDDSKIAVISSDLSHYHPKKVAQDIDSYCVKGIDNLEPQTLKMCEACGKTAVEASLEYALKHNLKSKTLDYRTSADAFGDESRVVGYGSFMFYKDGE